MAQQNNTAPYSGNAIKEAIDFRKKDFYPDFSSWQCQVLCFLHHHTGLNPVDNPDPKLLERDRNISKNQILGYIQKN